MLFSNSEVTVSITKLLIKKKKAGEKESYINLQLTQQSHDCSDKINHIQIKKVIVYLHFSELAATEFE